MDKVLKILNRVSYALHWFLLVFSIFVSIDYFKQDQMTYGILYIIFTAIWGMIAGVETVFITSKEYDF